MDKSDVALSRLTARVSQVAACGQVSAEEYLALYKLLAGVWIAAQHRLSLRALSEEEEPDEAMELLRQHVEAYFHDRGE